MPERRYQAILQHRLDRIGQDKKPTHISQNKTVRAIVRTAFQNENWGGLPFPMGNRRIAGANTSHHHYCSTTGKNKHRRIFHLSSVYCAQTVGYTR